jgi:hypothetical protein
MARQRPGNEQITQRLDSSVTGLDAQRIESLKRTQLLQNNKDHALKREQARLQKKYGAEHPRVAKIKNRLEYNQSALLEVQKEVELSQIRIPDFDSSTWMVHGRVLNNKLSGLPRLTLSPYDAEGKVEKRLGYACTDERGYFAIRYQFEEGKKPPFNEKTPFFLTVSGSEGKICHQEEEPLNVVIGQVDYRQIIVDETKCTPPPGWNEDNEDEEDDNDNGQSGEWAVTGTVTYDDGKPGTSLRVDIISKQTEESLINADTGRTGAFQFKLSTEELPDIFKQKTAFFITVTDRQGKMLHVTRKPLHAKVGGEEKLKIELKRAILPRR